MKFTYLIVAFTLIWSCSTFKKECSNPEYNSKPLTEIIEESERIIANNKERKALVLGLYGNLNKYALGTIRNVKLVKALYETWDPVVYVDPTTVPEVIIKELENLGAIVYKSKDYNKAAARFYIVDNPNYDRFVVRDSDSRLYIRELAAVADWMKTDFILHNMKDWPSHKNPLMGGMWGGKSAAIRARLGGKTIEELYAQFITGKEEQYGRDEESLRTVILAKVGENNLLSHESFKCNDLPNSRGFPIPLGPGLDAIGGQFE